VAAATASAQQPDPASVATGARLFKDRAGCSFCHGWAADGKGDERSPGAAPSLRETALERDAIIEVIKCGRPGKAMPYHDRFAYTDDRCYGVKAADLGNQMPQRASEPLQQREIEALADYVVAGLKGRGPVTQAECLAYFGAGAANCAQYPK